MVSIINNYYSHYKILFPYIRKRTSKLVLASILTIITSLSILPLPLLTKRFIDHSIKLNDSSEIIYIGIIIIMTKIVLNAIRMSQQKLFFNINQQIIRYIKQYCDFYYVKLGKNESNIDTPPRLTLAVSNYPNPFNPTTTIRYTVPKDGNVRLCIYNTRGQLITTLVNEQKNLGIHSVVWNGNDNNGNKVSSGIYFTRIIADGKTLTTKMLMLK